MSEKPRSPHLLLSDMLDSCRFLIDSTRNRTLREFVCDRVFRGSVERELTIIGEALFQLNREHPAIAELVPEYYKIITFRHVLVHGYAILDREKIWEVVQNKLAVLENQLVAMLESMS